MSENFLRGWAKAAGIGLRRDRFRAKSVSYTHLDVYQRQEIKGSDGGLRRCSLSVLLRECPCAGGGISL